MLGEDEALRIIARTLAMSRAGQTEALLFAETSALTRFANNHIHQNVEETDVRLQVRVVYGKKIGVAATNRIDERASRDALDRATELARHQVDNPDFVSLPSGGALPRAGAFVEATARCGPEERAAVVAAICRRSAEAGLNAAGAYKTTASEFAVGNSLGVAGYHRSTMAEASAVVQSPDSSGYADRASIDAAGIDGDDIGAEAVGRALRSHNPIVVEPGEYEVILEPYAVADILDWFAYLGFGAQAYQERRSFMSGRLGQQVLGDTITIVDDPLAPDAAPMPFDFEGVAKARLPLIERGVARNVCYDSYYAGKEGHASTGHALPAPNTFGPVPMHLRLEPGDATLDAMIAATKRGVLVTRFWYTRAVHPLTVVLTGMTRDGAWLVENGKIVAPIKNLRFTQNYVEALNHVQMIGERTSLHPAIIGHSRVPALKIATWNFTGGTEF